MALPYREALRQLAKAGPTNEFEENEFERRIIFITDAQPNTGGGPDDLCSLAEEAAKSGVHSTFIGVGLDFNAGMTDTIAKVPGGNYFSVHSESQFQQILVDDFNYIVTPLIYDVKVTLDDPRFEIVEAFGSPDADKATRTLLKLTTISGSAISSERGVKGGLVLLRLKATTDCTGWQGALTLEYRTHDGVQKSERMEIDLDERFKKLQPGGYESSGVRKGVLLSTYVSTVAEHLCGKPQPKLSNLASWMSGECDEIKDKDLLTEVEIVKQLASAGEQGAAAA
jgi:Ca-activated chloride channel family protein